MQSFGTVSYAVSAVLYLGLAVMLIALWRGRFDRALLLLALLLTSAWAATAAYFAAPDRVVPLVPLEIELFRNVAWLLFLVQALNLRYHAAGGAVRHLQYAAAGIGGLAVLLLVNLLAMDFSGTSGSAVPISGFSTAGFLLLAIAGLVLVEQLFRGVRPERRRAVKFLYIAIGGLFVYDLVLYADALLSGGFDTALWNARGLFTALLVPLIGMAAATSNPRWSRDIYVSHSAVFHFTALIAAAVYLLVLAAGTELLRVHGGTWGDVTRVFLLSAGILLLAVMVSSTRLRSYMRVLVGKHFFNYKYDYREEWLRIIRTLSKGGAGAHLLERAVQSIAQIVDSPGGVLWLQRDRGHCEPAACWEAPAVSGVREDGGSPLLVFLEQWQWVINLDEYQQEPEIYQDLVLPDWLQDYPGAWLIVPLMLDVQLLGFIVLVRPPVQRDINWEDRDLLKTASRQAATHIAQLMAAQALIEAREFQAFSKLSAFVMHDLKNLIAQLSLVVSNAKRHRNNPAFMEDAIKTVENSVDKMNRLIAQLRAGEAPMHAGAERADLVALIQEAIHGCMTKRPEPVFSARSGDIHISVNRDRMIAVLEHMIENAQDATPPDGRVEIRLKQTGGFAVIEIADTGCGMDEGFIRNRLFRPFDSTKGSGMGIGAYESREFVRDLGGDIDVVSRPAAGTTFTIRIPLAESYWKAVG